MINIQREVKESSVSAILIRADGTREDLGVIAYYHRNPLKLLWWNVKKKIKEKLNGKSSSI